MLTIEGNSYTQTEAKTDAGMRVRFSSLGQRVSTTKATREWEIEMIL